MAQVYQVKVQTVNGDGLPITGAFRLEHVTCDIPQGEHGPTQSGIRTALEYMENPVNDRLYPGEYVLAVEDIGRGYVGHMEPE